MDIFKIIGGVKRVYKNRKANLSVVIVAAGSSTRMNGKDKIFLEFNDRPALYYAIKAFDECKHVSDIIVVGRSDSLFDIERLCSDAGFLHSILVVAGGTTRTESVRNGLKHVGKDADYIAVHDGARPLVDEELIMRVFHAAQAYQAAVPGIPLTETITTVDKDHKSFTTPDRSTFRIVQTPQIFDAALLLSAYESARTKKQEFTDEASYVESMGMPVYVCEGSLKNIKLTHDEDIMRVQRLLGGKDD